VSAEAENGVSGRVQALLTVGIAVATLAIAVVGFLQVRASSKSGDAAQAGQQFSVLTMSSLLQSQEKTKVDYEGFLRTQEERSQAGNAFQQGVFSDPGSRALLRLVQERWQRLAERSQTLTPITLNSRDGPQNDLEFPRHVFARSTGGALRYQALQDSSNNANSAWEGRAAKYTAILTLLAVSLYLFGFALAMPRRVLGVFGAVGTLLLVVGVAWAVTVAAGSPKTVPAEAASEYSQGEVALETSTIGQDPAGFRSSIEHFTKAIHAWPGFARAYLGRANATLASAPLVQATLIPPDALRSVISDLHRAQGFGLDSGLVREQLAGAEFSLALHDQPGLFRSAAADARDAIAKVPADPVARYSLAISLLGAGDAEGARAAYRDAIARTLPSSPPFQQGWVSGALSDLEALLTAKPDLKDEITREKEFVVGSIAAGHETEPAGAASFTGLQVQVLPTTVTWLSGGATGYDPQRNVLSAQWYTRTGDNAWIGMPEVSGPVNAQLEPSLPRYSSRNITSSSIPPRCLGTGDYRVELYVDGHLAGEAETRVKYGSLQAFIDRALNLDACRPSTWRFSRFTLPGFRQGFVSDDGSRGLYLIRYDLSLLPAKLRIRPTAQITESLLESTVQSSQFLFPRKLTAESAVTHQPSMGLPGSSQRSFFAGSTLAYGQCAIDTGDKAAFVTIVFGPQLEFLPPDGSLIPIAASLTEYRYGGSSF
jgi:hypothetical protein